MISDLRQSARRLYLRAPTTTPCSRRLNTLVAGASSRWTSARRPQEGGLLLIGWTSHDREKMRELLHALEEKKRILQFAGPLPWRKRGRRGESQIGLG